MERRGGTAFLILDTVFSDTMKLAIAVAATKSYLHAWQSCIRSIATAAAHHAEAHFIFATDQSEEAKQAARVLKEELPEGWKITVIPMAMADDAKDYKEAAQMRIAALQGAAFAFARSKVRADRLWSVESDNLVPADALRVLEWTLDMPTADGSPYYDIAAATYPNGMFLGGFGSYSTQINEDFLPSERKLTPRLAACFAACEARPPSEREHKRLGRLRERAKKCPPDGSLWEVIQKHGWRRRGWMESAYPGIGLGAIVPTDWCGLGCTLMSKRALGVADFAGYEGKGTQDLFLCWRRWHPAGLRLACVPHVPCDHVKGAVHHVAYHQAEGECRGHLRTHSIPWIP
jgi:protein tyrosine phosphatase (PTP) superfamily phosphohydrolase (DUF442 family)